MEDKFWAQQPSVLIGVDIDPISDKPKVNKLNALARLSILIFILILIIKRNTRSILLPASVLIATSYMYFNPPPPNKREGFKVKKDKKKTKKSKKKKQQDDSSDDTTDSATEEDRPDNTSVRGLKKLNDKRNRYGFACQQSDTKEPERACVDGDPFGRVEEGINMSDLLTNLVEKPIPYNYRYNQFAQNSIGGTKRLYDYQRNNRNKTPKEQILTNDERMEELVNNRMRSDNLSYCNNPNFSAQNVYGSGIRGLAGYKTVDDPID